MANLESILIGHAYKQQRSDFHFQLPP